MMSSITATSRRNLWLGLMTAASTGATLLLACATPFPALAALASTYARRSEAMMLIGLAWLASQAVSFLFYDYPQDLNRFGWSAALLMAATGAVLAAEAGGRLGSRWGRTAKLVAGYVAAYVGFKAVVLLWTLATGADCAAFAPDVLARQFVRYGAILVGLVMVDRLVARLGVSPGAVPARA
jgi:hypothetical protein